MINQLQGQEAELNSLKAELIELYEPSCCHLHNLNDKEPDQAIIDLLNAMFKRIYKLKGMPDSIDKDLVKWYAKNYFSGVEKGFGNILENVDYDTPDYLALRNLRDNCYQFSAAKNYQQLKATTNALIRPDGKLRTYNEFKFEAFKINNEHVTSWLQAEYNLAVTGGQMSAEWQRAIETKDVLPLLQFDAVIDSQTTDLCRKFNGVIKPIDDVFWDLYYPPNHFGERSGVRKLSTGPITPTTDIVFPDKIPDIFKTNLAKNGLVFPKNHPYYTGLPHQFLEQAQKIGNGK